MSELPPRSAFSYVRDASGQPVAMVCLVCGYVGNLIKCHNHLDAC